jgi:hypothetical protein
MFGGKNIGTVFWEMFTSVDRDGTEVESEKSSMDWVERPVEPGFDGGGARHGLSIRKFG